jgi:hypothetical protein
MNTKAEFSEYTDNELIDSYSRGIADAARCSTKIGREAVIAVTKRVLKEIKRRKLPTYLYSAIS